MVESGHRCQTRAKQATLTDEDPVVGGIDESLLAAGVRHGSGQRWNVGVSSKPLGGGNSERLVEYRTEE